jgi:predicted enzyme related to lactoylglutathione lyase
MADATGIGGIFFRADDPDALSDWYEEHFGLHRDEYGSVVWGWRGWDDPEQRGGTVWSIFEDDTDYFGPGGQSFMVNLRVENLDEMLADLADAGIEPVKEPESFEYGRFAWVEDPEGHRIELWEPPDDFAFEPTFGRTESEGPIHQRARPTLGVRDVPTSAAFYKEVLQFDLDVIQDEPAAFALLRNGAARIALTESMDPAVADFAAVYIETSDVRAVYKRCRDHDVEIAVDIEAHPWGTIDFVVVDPDGHRIAVGEVVEQDEES